MEVKRISGKEERKVLTGLLVDKVVLGRVTAHWRREGMFRARWSNIIAEWCIAYFKRYGEAPGKNVSGLYEAWASENSQDKETIGLVDKYLGGLSEEYEALAKESNSEYVIDLAAKHFTRVSLNKLVEGVQGALDLGNVGTARKLVTQYERIEMGTGAGVDVLRDKQAMQEAFDEAVAPLIEYKGALGQFFKEHLQRDGFIAAMAPEKGGKSYWLEDMAWMAMRQRRKVAFFSVGDLSQRQMMRRFMARAARRPVRGPWPRTFRFPTAIRKKDGQDVEVRREDRVASKPMVWQEAKEACDAVISNTGTKDTLLRLSTHPMNSIGVTGIESILDDWERDGWIADVVVIDYADILDEEEGDDERGKTNKKWQRMRGMSQKRHILVITATQANAASYDAETMSKSNFSESKTKLAHVTGLFGINQSKAEKEKGVQRLNWIVLREGEFHESTCVYVAGCLDVAMPAIRSCWAQRAET